MHCARLTCALLMFGLGVPALAVEGLDRAKERSQEQLDQATRELSDLRQKIAAEKVPLARKLSDLEGRLTQLRRRQDEALKNLDAGSLDASQIKTELKLRQDEAGYITNLLDEYAKGLESRLNVGETERYSPLINRAKESLTDPDLTRDQKFQQQIEVVKLSIARLEDAVGGTRFPGSAIDPKGVLTEGQFALIGPVALFASKDGKEAGVAMPQSGSPVPAMRPLEASVGTAISSLISSGAGNMPLDPTRGGALKELVQKWSLIQIFKKGGPIMYPLLVVSILALAVVLERILFILGEQRKRDHRALQNFLGLVEDGNLPGAIAAGNASKYFVLRSLAFALEHRERSLANALVYANGLAMKRFRRGLGILDTAITIAPLLGLLGTVTGMMHSFSLIGGDLSAPGAITGGIAEALIATAFGLVIAIMCLVPYNYLNNRIEESRHELETAAAQLELLVHPGKGVVSAINSTHATAGVA